MTGRPALPGSLLLAALLAVLGAGGCRPAPEQAAPSLAPAGPPPPTPGQTLPALGATGSRGTAPGPGHPAPLVVAGFGPHGSTQGGGTIFVRFNQPMVALDQTGEDRTDVGITLDPKTDGRAYFQTPELLVFEPKGDLPLAHRLTARLVGTPVALSGARLGAPLQWEFETPRPRVTGWSVQNLEDQEAMRNSVVVLSVDQPTTAAQLQLLLTARAYSTVKGQPRHAQPVAVQVTEATQAALKRLHYDYYSAEAMQGRMFLIAPVGLWPGQSEVELTVQKGLGTARGPLTSERPFTTKFPTLSPLKLVSSDCPPSKPCGLTPVALHFNNRIPEDQLKKLSIVPKPCDLEVSLLDGWSDGGREVNFQGVFMPGTSYRILLPADLADRFGQRLGQATTVVAVTARRPTMELNQPSGILRAGEPATVGVITRHVRTLRVRGAVLDDQTAVELLTEQEVAETRSDDDQTPPPAPPPWPATPLGQFERTYTLSPHGPSDWDELTLDLAALSDKAHRAVLIEVQASELVAAAAGQPIPPPVRGLYRLTDLGLVRLSSQPRQIMEVIRLSTGKPVAGVQLAVYQAGQPKVPLGKTDATGVLEVKVPPALAPSTRRHPAAMLVAASADPDDHAYLVWPNHDQDNNEPQAAVAPKPELRHGERVITHLVTERDAYLPGELVRVVGWSAIDTPYERSGLRRARAGTPVKLELEDARGRIVVTHQTQLTAEGKFWAELPIPERGALGRHAVHARLLRDHTQVSVKVEDFRVPEFRATATVSQADVVPCEAASVVATASYFFGGPVRFTRAYYSQTCTPTAYTPPGLGDQWAVGAPIPDYRRKTGDRQYLPAGGLGSLRFAVLPPSEGEEFDRSCRVDVALTDSAFQTIGAQTSYLAHAARYYLAIERQLRLVTEGDTVRVALRALAVDGTRLAAPGARLSVVWVHEEPVYTLIDGKNVLTGQETQRDPVSSCTLDLSATGPDLGCQFAVAHPGQYELVARGRDKADTRHARSLTTLWVQPKPTEPAPVLVPPKPPATLEIAVSSPKVKPGDVLRVTLRVPWLGDDSGVLTLARNGLREHRSFQLHNKSAEFTFPVDDSWFPEVHLSAFLVHIGRGRPPHIVHASNSVTMLQDHRQLQVTVTVAKEASPGAELPITVQVQDGEKKPCAAHVALWAVDEAVLSLTNYSVQNPLPDFIPTRWANTAFYDDFSAFIAPFTAQGSDPWFSRGISHSRGGELRGHQTRSPAMAVGAATSQNPRSRFETTPLFLADVVAGPDGFARAKVQLPDNLTTFRITAVASARLVDGESPGRFGLNDARVRVSAPLIVRAALPRLMRPGDAAEIGALVNNLGGPRGRLQLTVRLIEKGAPSLQLSSGGTAAQTLEAGAQLRLPFSIVALRATKTPALVEVAATLTPDAAGAPVLHDAVQLPLPVADEPTLRERVATYGDLTSDEAIRIPVQAPEAVRRDSGGLTLSASTSLLGGVADAAAELIEYPYGCVEQTASRLLPLVALKDVMKTYPLPIPDGDVQRYLDSGVQRILSMQTASGGFAYWPGGREPNVYASGYATWVLYLASRAGYPIPATELGRAADYLQSLVEPPPPPVHAAGAEPDDSTDAPEESPLLGFDSFDSARRALAVQVLSELGRPVPQALADLLRRRDELPLFARALLVMAVKAQPQPAKDPRLSAEALAEELLNNVAELPGTAHVSELQSYEMESLFHSATRTDAMVLLALLRTHPTHPLVTKLARGLLERRGGAAWRNTQETSYAVLALAEYAHRYEHDMPALITRAWLPGISQRPQWEASFNGRSFATQTIELPMAQLLPELLPAAVNPSPVRSAAASSGLILQRSGQGRLYYRVGFEWTPLATELPARNQGLRVERRLRTAKGEVTADTLLPPAEPVAVDLTIENRALLHYVVVDVPIPAGLETVQLDLGFGQQASILSGERSRALSHAEGRRDRVLLFFNLLQPGTHRHTVHLRTTTPGRYTLPPALAETMYTPELYGRSTSGRIVITAQLPDPHTTP